MSCLTNVDTVNITEKYGFFRPVIGGAVRQYLTCGDLKNGFARVRCCDCRDEYLLAFSCIGKSLRDNILYPVPSPSRRFYEPEARDQHPASRINCAELQGIPKT